MLVLKVGPQTSTTSVPWEQMAMQTLGPLPRPDDAETLRWAVQTSMTRTHDQGPEPLARMLQV